MSTFSRNWKHHWKCTEQKGNFQTALVITFWNFKKYWYRFDQPQAKRNSISSTQYNKLGAVVASQLEKLLRILGNQEMLKVSQIYVDPQPSAPSSFKKLDLGDRYQTFLSLSNFIGFLYFVLIFFPGLSDQASFWSQLSIVAVNINFLTFSITSNYISVFQ